MRSNIRTLGAVITALALVVGAGQPASAAFSSETLKCREAIEKASAKLSKTILKSLTGCHKARAKDGAMSLTNCNDIDAADTKDKVPKAEQKLSDVALAGGKCEGLSPSAGLYYDCPAPCADTIATYVDVTDCLICLARNNAAAFSDDTNGTPDSPLTAKDDSKCQGAIGTNGSKVYNMVMTDVTKCQSTFEKSGGMTTDACTDTNFPSTKVTDAATKAYDKIADSCAAATFTNLDSCASGQFLVAECVKQEALDSAQEFVSQVVQLGSAATTTTTTTTTTLPATSHAQCPDLGQLVLYSKDSTIACSSNTDCGATPLTCDVALGHCVSVTSLDSGWTGLSHNSDINDAVLTQARLVCPGPPSPGCGVCTVAGVDPTPGNCRCSNNTRTVCDKPFAADAVNCGGNTCDCYFGSPFPLAAAGTPACIVNRFKQDITGTANIDLGEGQVSAKLSTRVYLGIDTISPCPRCDGDPTPGDGVRGGTCVDGDNAGSDCDGGGINHSFPTGSYTPPGAVDAGYSLDCMPASGKNVSGAGLNINLSQSTGTASLAFGVDCDGVAGGALCPCRQCSGSSTNRQVPCTGDSDCTPLGGSCTVAGGSFACLSNSDCTSLNYGTCNVGIHRCTLATGVSCTTNADCLNKNGSPCNVSTCTSDGAGEAVQPNGCTLGDTCVDLDGGFHGECSSGPDEMFCDGRVRADNTGVLACSTNDDCTAEAIGAPGAGNCTLTVRRPCFLDPIKATGAADPYFPVGAATFCIPPTSSPGINATSGLPGPGRTTNQAASATFCKSDHLVQYTPGSSNCP